METKTTQREIARSRHIYDVVGSYGLELRRIGGAMQTNCPRPHKKGRDTNASLTIYDSSQRFYCFGCRWWGDALDFIKEMERINDKEAVSRMRHLSGAPQVSPAFAPKKRRARNPRRDGVLLEEATSHYERCLYKTEEGKKGRSYLVGRKVDKGTAKKLRLGYAPGGTLAKHLTELGFPVERQLKSGLFLKYPVERFAGMVTVPETRNGRPAWITGRAVDAEARPRFQSMPGGKVVLGAGSVRHKELLVVTEGVFDYVTLRRWGINAVALAGNGNPAKLLAELRRLRPAEIVFALDTDEATALLKMQLAAEIECLVRDISLPNGVEDVADLGMLADGKERFEIATLEASVLRAEAAQAALAE